MSNKRVTSGIKRAGGKFYQAKWIHECLPSRPIFVDLCCGNCSVAIESNAEKVICNDIDQELINYFRVVRDHPVAFINTFNDKPYGLETFEWAADWEFSALRRTIDDLDTKESIKFATKYLIRNRMSRDGKMNQYTESQRLRRGLPEQISSYLSAISELDRLHHRIQGWQFSWLDALEILDKMIQDENAIIYIDLPYKMGDRTTKNLYRYEVEDKFHTKVLDMIKNPKAVCAISHYKDDEYMDVLSNYKCYTKEVSINMGSSKTKNKKTEYLWVNI